MASEFQIKHNGYITVYPDGSARILAAARNVFRESGWEERGAGRKKAEAGRRRSDEGAGDDSARRRARSAVRDIALSNDFEYFVTLTIDPQRLDRYDVAAVIKRLGQWLDNQVRRKGLKYVIVAEFHKDKAVHFHGFINEALKMHDSGTVIPPGERKPRKPRSAAERERWLASGGKPVYNIPGWTYGYTTAIRLYGEYDRAVSYVCKYISKSGDKVAGRWYYSGGDLKRPAKYACDIDMSVIEAAGGSAYELPELGCRCVSLRLKKEEFDCVRGLLEQPGGAACNVQH